MATDSMPLTAPHELVGQWYVPEGEERSGSGRLLFDPVEGLTLETVSDRPLLRRDGEPTLLGITVDGRLVTLRNVHSTTENYNSRGGVLTKAHVRTAFVGMHATTEDDLRFHKIEARLSHLNEWCYLSGVDLSEAVFPASGKITIEHVPPLVLARPPGARVFVRFDFDAAIKPDRADRPYEISLVQRAWLTIQPTQRWSYDDFGELLTRIRWFFGFAAGAQDQLLELRAEATVVSRTMGARGSSRRHRASRLRIGRRRKCSSAAPT
jgi:hypothetical protein